MISLIDPPHVTSTACISLPPFYDVSYLPSSYISLLFGIIAELAATRALGITPFLRVFIATGILGGYTTFSTFSLDAVTLMSEGATLSTLLYAGVSVFLGFLATYGGLLVAKLAIR